MIYRELKGRCRLGGYGDGLEEIMNLGGRKCDLSALRCCFTPADRHGDKIQKTITK